MVVGATDHVAPFHCSASGSLAWPAAFMVDPTAQQSVDPTQVTPDKAAPVGLCGSARVEPDHVDPSQWSNHGLAPWDLYSRLGRTSLSNGLADAVPTAQQSVALVQLTEESWSSLCPEAGMAAIVQDDPSQRKASEPTTSPEAGSSVPPTAQHSLAAGQLTENSSPPMDGAVATDQSTPFQCSMRTVGSFPCMRVC